MSIRARWTLMYTVLLAGAVLLFSALLFSTFRFTYVRSVDAQLEETAARVAVQFQVAGRLPPFASLGERTTFVQVRTADTVLAQTGVESGVFPLPQEARSGNAVFTTETDADGRQYRLYTEPIAQLRGELVYVQVAYTLQLMDAVMVGLVWPVGLGALLVTLLGALGAWILAHRALGPVRQLAARAQEIGESGNLSLRVEAPASADEVGALVATFNGMLSQLEGLYARLVASVDAQQRFVADASHELRTPLTIIRGNVEYLQRAGTLDPEALADIQSEAERMSHLVEELLTMARADAGQAPQLAPVRLGPLLEEVCRKAQALPHQVTFRTELPEALNRVTVLAHADWLQRAFLILIDNAFKYTPAGEVTVRAGRQADGVVVQVIDTGIGIAPEDLPHVFDRFYRADRARGRGGAGLGLAIARWVAGVHGGRLTVESELGKGSIFSLWLPIPSEMTTLHS
jgi:two-component system OmpR family sensor kinase